MNNQIFPPISRLLHPIEGTDEARVASCLGLDASKFRHVTRDRSEEDFYTPFMSQVKDEERFKDVDRLEIVCKQCTKTISVFGMIKPKVLYGIMMTICSYDPMMTPIIGGWSLHNWIFLRRMRGRVRWRDDPVCLAHRNSNPHSAIL
jgi:hypothetical protein